MLEVVGLITARGGSKGIPRKNVRLLAGKPLIAWTIETALDSRYLARVILSSDDEEIMETAREWGAEVLFKRPAKLARDDSSHMAVVRHFVKWLKEHEGYRPDYVMVLQPPCPFRSSADIDRAIELAQKKNADAVVSVAQATHHPYLTRRMTEAGTLSEFVSCEPAYARRQDLPPAYALNGAIYLNRCDSLGQHQTLVPEGSYGFIMPPERSLDIDTPWDFHVAELILQDRMSLCDAGIRTAELT
ncbi:MAG: acylneuraminate cytidylyltransferase family protein [Planctomycetes bacterium]|nr:acylneuraminate cytidylyltransferase family protein [Planctomycetota bacterium]